MKFPQNDGHAEKLEIKREGLGGVQWKTRESEGVLTKSSRGKIIGQSRALNNELFFQSPVFRPNF